MDPVDPGLVAEKTAEMKAQKIAAKLKKRPKETPDLADLLSKSPMCSSDTLSVLRMVGMRPASAAGRFGQGGFFLRSETQNAEKNSPVFSTKWKNLHPYSYANHGLAGILENSLKSTLSGSIFRLKTE